MATTKVSALAAKTSLAGSEELLINDSGTSKKVTATNLLAGATVGTGDITTAKLADDAVTGAKLADDAVSTAHIADDAVTAAKLANSINTEIAANTAKVTNATHSGEVTGATALTIADNVVDEANLKVSNSPTNGYFLSAQSGNTGGLTWAEVGGGVEVSNTEPSSPSEGDLWWKGNSDILYIYDGSAFVEVSDQKPATTGGTVTINAIVEGGTFNYDLGTDFTDATDADSALVYTLHSGSLPSGASLPTGGNSAMTGTAGNVSSNTNYTFTVKATDTAGNFATQAYQQTINTVAPTVTGGTVTITAANEGTSPTYDVDTDFTYPTGSTRKSSAAYAVQSGSLPTGLSLNADSGVISGTPTNGSFTFTIRGTDTDGDTADQSYSWTINNVVPTSDGGTVTISAINEGVAANYDVNNNFTFATGSTLSAFSVVSGSLPTGTSLNTSSGVISGTATHNNTYTFTIRATDTDGDTVDQAYTFTINNVVPTSDGGTVTITAINENASGNYDVDNNFTFAAGSTFSAYSVQSGSLPAGLSLNTSTGVISGTASAVGSTTTSTFTIRGTDTDGDTVDQAYSWTVNNLPEQTQTFTSSGNWNAPAGVDNVNVNVIGGGGGGGGGVRNDNVPDSYGGNGGNGGFYTANVSVSAGTTYSVNVGGGGSAGNNGYPGGSNAGGSGGGSRFGNNTQANGGAGGGAGAGGQVHGSPGSDGSPSGDDGTNSYGAGGARGFSHNPYGGFSANAGQAGRVIVKWYGNH